MYVCVCVWYVIVRVCVSMCVCVGGWVGERESEYVRAFVSESVYVCVFRMCVWVGGCVYVCE
jgi:hypothetical protein